MIEFLTFLAIIAGAFGVCVLIAAVCLLALTAWYEIADRWLA